MNSDLQEKLKQTRPFGSAEEAVYLRIQIASEEMRAGFNELFRSRDLTLAQYNVLRILRGAGDDGLSCREVSERMINRDSDITRMLDRLEARGLITRERQADDRRVVLTYITKAGIELVSGLDRPVADLHKRQLRSLTRKELETLGSLLTKVAANTK